jgi:pimeloyl-ACP methyl ester carboxylesterase
MGAVTYRSPEIVTTEHTFEVPLDHNDPAGEQIEVFAREVRSADPSAPQDAPWLVYLQGGPGFEASRPLRRHTPSWLGRALSEFRVLLLDQRGVGRSSPIGPDETRRYSPAELAQRLTHYRADSIVRDAELIRVALKADQWSILGQSFGGFCAVTYLSLFPESLREALICGGLAPLDASIDDVYTATYRRTIEHVRRYFQRYPDDRERVADIVKRLDDQEVRLPNGDRLTSDRFRQTGNVLGSCDGSEKLHNLIEQPFDGPAFRYDVEWASPFARNPLYAVVHESCWANAEVTNWSAARVRPEDYAHDPTILTGEHIYPWMFDDVAALRPFAETAQILAEHSWGPLYDAGRLSVNAVPCAAAVYVDDMYVEREFAERTAAQIGGLKMWLTNEYEHDGLFFDGARVLGRLLDLARGNA